MKKICKKCGELKEYQAKGLCRKCYHRKYRLENKESIKKHSRKYYLENKEKVKAHVEKYQVENPEKIKAYSKKYYGKNKEKIREYRQSFKGKLNNRQAHIKRRANGRVRKGDLSKLIDENIFKYGIITCEKCKKECEENYHIDHIVPISKDGGNEHENLQILCALCNQKKHIAIMDYRENSKNNQLYLKG